MKIEKLGNFSILLKYKKAALAVTAGLVSIALLFFFSDAVVRTISQAYAHSTRANLAQNALPRDTVADGPYTVQGNTVLGANGQPYLFHGVARDGLEFDCLGDGHFDQQELAYMGPGVNTATATYWDANTVRLPLSESLWLYGLSSGPQTCTPAQYQATVKQAVDALTALHLNVILELHWSDAGGQFLPFGSGWAMPDADSQTFWQQVAPIYASYTNVLFELYNEPHPPSWSCWAAPCTITNDTDASHSFHPTYASVGMQALVNAVRSAGASNLVIAAGIDWGYDLSQIAQYPLTGSNIVYDTHPYPYSEKLPNTWDAAFGTISATYPVISAENGEYDCGTSYMSQLLSYFDAHHIGWIAWAWTVSSSTCTYPVLTLDYNGTPSSGYGQFIYQYLHSYASGSSPALPGPLSKTWYFAEGKVGAGFTEYLTIENSDPVNACAVNIEYLLGNGGAPVTKSVTVRPGSRFTESVNSDLHVAANSSAYQTNSTVITVNPTLSPGCSGVVAERPMYFSHFAGVSSGSDVVGFTHTGTSFYFADVPTGGGFASFITVLNPGSSSATVTASYDSGGQTVRTQTIVVPAGARGTIIPNNAGPLTHAAVAVTSDQPVMVERPSYFSNVNEGNARTLSGASSVVGVETLSTDWLFAEGYTGSGFQEYFVLANFGATDDTANVILEFSNGHTETIPVTINALDQTIVDVNQAVASGVGTCDTTPCQPTQDVSAEISASANIVAQREMYFHYNHFANGRGLSASGGTDVIGQPGPAANTVYSFAEGYTNSGYDEWLTLQNPTPNAETINATLVNGNGLAYTQAFAVLPHSRFTVDVTALVVQHLIKPGGGYTGYEISMTIQAGSPGAYFVAERPMYWNTGSSGTQGGSDVIGYIGG
jgi:endoglucanase